MRRQDIEAWVQSAVDSILAERDDGLQWVEITFRPEGPRRVLRVTLDREGGVSLEHCQQVSRALSDLLDEHDPIPHQYDLEVSSPGLDRPLVREEDYVRFAGRTVHVTTYTPIEGRRRWQGELVGLFDDQVHLAVDGRTVAIPYKSVARCRLVPEF